MDRPLLRHVFYRLRAGSITVVSPFKKHLSKTKESLALLQKINRKAFNEVQKLKDILIYPGTTELGCLFEKEKIYINQPKHIDQSSVIWWASTILHEAWHLHQYTDSPDMTNGRAEYGAYRVQRKFLMKAKAITEVQWLDKMQKAQWWKGDDTSFKKQIGYNNDARNTTQREFEQFIKLYKQHKLTIKDLNI